MITLIYAIGIFVILFNVKIYFLLRKKISLYNKLNSVGLQPPKPIKCFECGATYHREDAKRRKDSDFGDYEFKCPHCGEWND